MRRLLLVSATIAVLAAFFASTRPDGLDFVAEKFGFTDKGIERVAPMANYRFGFLPEGTVSSAVAGIAGVLILLAIFWLSAYELNKNKPEHGPK